MNTSQINAIISSDSKTNEKFQGVLARDQFINCEIIFPSLFVCNTDNSNQPGTHWVAIYFSELGKCEYFDSYGLPPLFSDVTQKLLKIDQTFTYNEKRLQSFQTNVCGTYSIIYCMLKSRNYSLSRILEMFLLTDNFNERDHALKFYIENIYSELFTHVKLPPIHQVNGYNQLNGSYCSFE